MLIRRSSDYLILIIQYIEMAKSYLFPFFVPGSDAFWWSDGTNILVESMRRSLCTRSAFGLFDLEPLIIAFSPLISPFGRFSVSKLNGCVKGLDFLVGNIEVRVLQ